MLKKAAFSMTLLIAMITCLLSFYHTQNTDLNSNSHISPIRMLLLPPFTGEKVETVNLYLVSAVI